MLGLTEDQVLQSRHKHGWNTTEDEEYSPEPLYRKILEQLCNPLIGLLLASCLISTLLGQYENSFGIIIAVLLVGVVGAWQEAKTEASVEALRQLAPNKAHVYRQGRLQEVMAKEVVVGDVVEIRCGDRCAADVEMVEFNGLMVDDCILTGEGEPRVVSAEGSVVFMGTTVCHGWGRGRVVAVGRRTRFGEMVKLIGEDANNGGDRKTPLQLELDRLAHQLTVGSGILIVCLSIISLLLPTTDASLSFTNKLIQTVTMAVSLAVAAIPEGLPVVSTVTMALAVRRLATRHVIVKRLAAVEAMGSVRGVCFDKTGTLTMNRLVLSKFAFEDATMGEEEFMSLAAACTDVSVVGESGGDLVGNRLDCCLVKYYKQKYNTMPLYSKQSSVLFSSERRSMQVTLEDGRVVSKGAIESIQSVPEEYRKLSNEWSRSGLRVIGVSVNEKFVGLLAFEDELRAGASTTVSVLHSMGLEPIMLTGDSAETANAVALALHWPTTDTVHSRQSPSQKLDFITSSPYDCAMVGDGVNDGAAVKKAAVGIAMGGPQSTDVARQAADIVLSNDRLSGIIDVVKEGRLILWNVRRFVGFQLSSAMVSVALVVLTSHTKSLTPLHLLLLNIVMDGPPAQSLAMSRVCDADLMRRPDRVVILDGQLLLRCIMKAGCVVIGCLLYVDRGGESLLPPLLILSMANAYTWTNWTDCSVYLHWCMVACVGLIAGGQVIEPWGRILEVGEVQWMQLIFYFFVYLALFTISLPRRLGYEKM